VCFENAAFSQAPQFTKRSRVIVLNTLTGSADLPFYGVLAQGIPRLMGLDKNNTLDAPNAGEQQAYVLRHVVVEGHPCLVPDQKALENDLLNLDVRVIQEAQDAVI
jgi:chemosensory pili system protein ChpC